MDLIEEVGHITWKEFFMFCKLASNEYVKR